MRVLNQVTRSFSRTNFEIITIIFEREREYASRCGWESGRVLSPGLALPTRRSCPERKPAVGCLTESPPDVFEILNNFEIEILNKALATRL